MANFFVLVSVETLQMDALTLLKTSLGLHRNANADCVFCVGKTTQTTHRQFSGNCKFNIVQPFHSGGYLGMVFG